MSKVCLGRKKCIEANRPDLVLQQRQGPNNNGVLYCISELYTCMGNNSNKREAD